MEFKLHLEYQPAGDRAQAIEALVKGFKEGSQFQILLVQITCLLSLIRTKDIIGKKVMSEACGIKRGIAQKGFDVLQTPDILFRTCEGT